MNLTSEELKQIIREELRAILSENRGQLATSVIDTVRRYIPQKNRFERRKFDKLLWQEGPFIITYRGDPIMLYVPAVSATAAGTSTGLDSVFYYSKDALEGLMTRDGKDEGDTLYFGEVLGKATRGMGDLVELPQSEFLNKIEELGGEPFNLNPKSLKKVLGSQHKLFEKKGTNK